eukprot:TRINITY_DN7083_c0_g1_i1.p1 TRINITY_DN7083_c0_g1~~TRINITY_DN7083_c0_g1_i1.p1  ORF type:complete len:357 (+),score=86.83 TRINITY_DN7083_c0_g1_i1:253-1323(+)
MVLREEEMPLINPKTSQQDLQDIEDPYNIPQFLPFIHHQQRTNFYSIFKTVVFGVTLYPIRFACANLLIVIGWFLTWLVSLGCDDPSNPIFIRRRPFIKFIATTLCRLILQACGFLWISVPNRLPHGPSGETYTIVSNHVGWADIFVLATKVFPSFLAKSGVRDYPFIGLLAKMWGCYFINRDDPAAKNLLIDEIRKRSTRIGWSPLAIFPEGTTTNGFQLIKFKKGAFVSGAPVQPVILKYPFKHTNIAWDTIHGMHSMFLAMTQFYNRCSVVFLPIYYPSEEEKQDPFLYAENVRQYMARESGYLAAVPVGARHKLLYESYLDGTISWGEALAKLEEEDYSVPKEFMNYRLPEL